MIPKEALPEMLRNRRGGLLGAAALERLSSEMLAIEDRVERQDGALSPSLTTGRVEHP